MRLLTYKPTIHPGQSTTTYLPQMAENQRPLSYPLSMLQSQSNTPYPPPMPPAQGAVSYPLPMPQGQTIQAAVPQVPPTLPTAFTTPFAPQTASHFDCPSAVWCIRIPANGSPIERMVIGIVLDIEQPTKRVPFPKDWWWDKDPTAQPMVYALKIQVYSS